MNLKHYYWFFQKALSHKFCDDLIKHGLSLKTKETALTMGLQDSKNLNKKEIKNLKKIRDSKIVWMNDDWIYKKILPFVQSANKSAGWNFQFDWSESCQFTIYDRNQHYDWHCDSWLEPYTNKDINHNGKIRKISCIVSLTDPSKYTGGELEFDFRNHDGTKKPQTHICEVIKPKGSIVVFPSFVYHRVKPVTKGTRYSLVIWNIGNPFV
jgi:PKHD-type hydroxylase